MKRRILLLALLCCGICSYAGGSFAGLLKGCDAEGTLVEESLYKTFEIVVE